MKKFLFSLAVIASVVFSSQSTKAQDYFKNGYRGYADLGYTIGVGDYELNRFEISTTHGYQVNPYFFIGAGVGFHFMPKYETKGMYIAHDTRDSKVSIPLFVDFRGTFTKTKLAPFIDIKLGHFVTNGDGFYASASAGCRLKTIEKQAISISIGYTFEKLEFETFDRFTSSSSMSYTRDASNDDTEGISIKLGYEF